MRVSRPLAALLCALCLTAAAPLHGQNSECAERTFIANVFDHAVSPMGLTAENFQITYRGKALTPRFVSYSEGPRRVIVLLDVSGSMRGETSPTKWAIARLAVADLLSALPPGSKVGLITFATTTETRAPLSVDREPIADWLNSEQVLHLDVLHGRTALYNAIQSAVDQLQPTEPGDSVYLITDGGDNASKTDAPKVRKILRESGVRLFAFILPPGSAYSVAELMGSEALSPVVNDSGGFVQTLNVAPDVRALDERVKQELRANTARLSLQISGFYALAVNFSENPPKNKRWEVTLIESGKRKKDTWVGFPHEVPPCQPRVAQK